MYKRLANRRALRSGAPLGKPGLGPLYSTIGQAPRDARMLSDSETVCGSKSR